MKPLPLPQHVLQSTDEAASEGASEPRAESLRLRVVFLVFLTQAALIWWVTDSEIARHVYLICYALMMPTVLYMTLARLLRRWLPLTRKEILLGYIALTATLPIVGFGGIRFLLPGMGYLSYYSESQPEWLRYLTHLSSLPVLHDPNAIRGLYRGGASVPWTAWTVPIAFWSVYLLLLVGVWVGLAAVLHRIWIHQERLTFPITVLPLQLTDPQDDLLRRPVFWAGFGIPLVLQSLLVLHDWFPSVQCFQLKAFDVRPLLFPSAPWNALPDLYIGFYPMAIGLAFFVPSAVSFSCLFFWVTTRLSYVGGAMAGIESAGTGAARFPFPLEQAAGAWIAFAGLALWGARFHWVGLAKSLSSGDRRAILRLGAMAVICALLCAVMMAVTGVPFWLALGIVIVYVAFVLTGARVRAEAGGMWTFAPITWTPYHVVHALSGSAAIPQKGLVAAGTFDLIHVDIRGQALPYLMEGLKIAESVGIRWRTVLFWVGVASVSALALGWWHGLSAYYTLGGATPKVENYPLYKAQVAMQQMHTLANSKSQWDYSGILAMLFGAGVVLLLTLLRMRFLAFPLHPVGYVLCNTYSMSAFFVPFLIAWTAKVLIQRIGGSRGYQRALPFFVGLVLGDILTQAGWTIIGSLFHAPIYQFLT